MNRIILFLLTFYIGICSISAQTNTETADISNPANINYQLSPVTSVSLLPVMHCENDDHCFNIRGIFSGILLIAAGTVLSVNGYYNGEEHYRSYKNSAFTENTDRKRRKVVISNLKCIGGGVIAGSGLLVTILSF